MKKQLFGIAFCCGIVLFAAACGSSRMKPANVDLTALEWRLMSVKTADGQLLTPDNTKTLPTLKVNADGTANGFAGCNGFSGPVTVKGGSITFGNMASTRKFCFDTMDVENAMLEMMRRADNYVVENGNLHIKKGSEVLASFTSFR